MVPLVLLLLTPGQVATVDSAQFAKKAQVAAVAATVRIVNGSQGTTGSGVIIRTQKPFVYILTAAHVVGQAERLEVDTFSADSYPRPEKVYRSAQVIARLKGINDLALVRLSTSDRMQGCVRVCPPRLVPRRREVAVLAVGCAQGKAPTCLIKTAERKQVRKGPEAEGGVLWEVNAKSDPGRSGGPLLGRRGYLLGIASGTNDGKAYYSHISEIHSFLKQQGLKWLYEDEED